MTRDSTWRRGVEESNGAGVLSCGKVVGPGDPPTIKNAIR